MTNGEEKPSGPTDPDKEVLAAYRGLAPGWYRDRKDPSRARYWDGTSLSEETRVVATESTSTPAPSQDPASQSPPAGWYREKGNLTTARYWDGAAWTDQTRQVAPLAGSVAAGEAGETGKPTPARRTAGPRGMTRGSHSRSRPIYKQGPFWVICGLLVLVVVGVVITQVTKTPNPRATGSTTATTTKVSTTTVPALTTTTVPVPPAPQPTADTAANALVTNWASGDKAVALRVATPPAVDTLFAVAYPSGLAINRGCSDSSPPVTCTFGPPGGDNPADAIYSLLVARAPDGDWYVSSVQIEG
ncbi:MAG: DUF2510 domain-containing protein [Acidimicrobiales bacterium]